MKIKEFISSHKRSLAFFLVLLIIYALLLAVFRYFDITRDDIEAILIPLGIWGIVVAFSIQILTSLTPLPDAPLAFVTVLLYGPLVGSSTILLGMLVATAINFGIARRFGRRFIFKHFPETENYTKKYSKRATVESLIVLRFFSFVTFDIVSYIAALSNVGFLKFMISSLLGLIPLVISHALVAQGLFSDDPLEIVLSWIIPGIFSLIIAYLARAGRYKIN